jgi:hypothetical protein
LRQSVELGLDIREVDVRLRGGFFLPGEEDLFQRAELDFEDLDFEDLDFGSNEVEVARHDERDWQVEHGMRVDLLVIDIRIHVGCCTSRLKFVKHVEMLASMHRALSTVLEDVSYQKKSI